MDTNTLIKYIEDALSKDDTELVENWIKASDNNKKIVEQLYELLFINDRISAFEEFDINKSYDSFKRLVNRDIPKPISKTYSLLRRIASVAAVAFIFLMIGTFATIGILDNTSQTIRINTNLGERAQVDLPDGSKVWLNACSSVEYKKSLLTRKRIANIEGEGYFEIEHDKTFPFIVKNNTSEIRVLGTKFNVRSNHDETTLIVSLLEGAISFSDISGAYARLNPGESVIYNKESHSLHVQGNQDFNHMAAWLQGRLVFDNTSLEDISRSLERHYNVKISFEDEHVKNKRLTAEFGMSDNIYQILSILELTKSFEYKFKDREITIKSISNK